MTTDRSGESKKPVQRKLGRGLDALLAVPVEINLPKTASAGAPAASMRERGGVEASGAAAGTGSTVVPPTVESPVGTSRRSGEETQRDVPRGTPAANITGSGGGSTPPLDTRSTGADGSDGSGGLVEIAVDQLRPNQRQPRQDFDAVSISALAASIRTAGVMQPIVARPLSDGTYEIIAGERRWRAARQVGLLSIPALLREVDDQTAAEWALVENIQREDLNPIERSTALRRLVEDFGLTHQELASRVGLDRATVTNLLRLSELDAFTSDAVRRGQLSQGHAKVLLGIAKVDLRHTLAAAAIAGEWSVRELERRVQQTIQNVDAATQLAANAQDAPLPGSAHLRDLERRLSEHLGSRVTIQLGRKKGSGRLCIDFFSLDQFDGILSRLGFDERG